MEAVMKGYDTSAVGEITQFTDVGNVSNWVNASIKWVIDSALLSGKGSGILGPEGNATRAEVTAILQRFIENITK